MNKYFLSQPEHIQKRIKLITWIVFGLSIVVFYTTSENNNLTVLNSILSLLILGTFILGILMHNWTKKRDNPVEESSSDIGFLTQDIDYKEEFPIYLQGCILKWAYNVNLAFPQNFSAIQVGESENLTLDEELDNEYDPEAVQVFKGDKLLGYLYKGNIKDMVKKYFFKQKGYKPAMIVNKVDEENERIEISLAFYKEIDLETNPAVIKIKTSINNSYDREERDTRIDALEDLEVNDLLTVEEDFEYGYLLYTKDYREVGRLSESVEEKIDEFMSSNQGYVFCLVSSVKLDEEGNIKIRINVYLVKKF
ncbi:hypothetical protein [Candidatus Xianfuyuplasma coldseepsis]|uniref:HIRAN domain-containing protein n=1 Tax=Candidatus Xianfuyuplasma coldseepsis TaxID=2782163 RepID=A0A7L7KQV2_9MOLU|nr:hypothetical protein [Xianfuyuplasma coldseepsis]QMS85103.1 hypothetical protein G4Z02_04880 [Xianfuyuplasma coldseepsis]